MSADNLIDLGQGDIAERLEAAVGKRFEEREERTKAQVFELLDSGKTLEPQLAIQKWMELYAMDQLKRTIRASKRKATAASKRFESDLTSP